MVENRFLFRRHRKPRTFKTTNGSQFICNFYPSNSLILDFQISWPLKKLVFSNERNVNWVLNIGLVWFSRNYRECSQINKIITINSLSQLFVMHFKYGVDRQWGQDFLNIKCFQKWTSKCHWRKQPETNFLTFLPSIQLCSNKESTKMGHLTIS